MKSFFTELTRLFTFHIKIIIFFVSLFRSCVYLLECQFHFFFIMKTILFVLFCVYKKMNGKQHEESVMNYNKFLLLCITIFSPLEWILHFIVSKVLKEKIITANTQGKIMTMKKWLFMYMWEIKWKYSLKQLIKKIIIITET